MSEGQTRKLTAGQGFMIFPDQVAYYEADRQQPWCYTWIAFRGLQAASLVRQAGLSPDQPIVCSQSGSGDCLAVSDCFRLIAASLTMQQGRDQRLLGLLYVFLSILAGQNPNPPPVEDLYQRRDWYVRQAKDYLEINYAQPLTIQALARHIGLDRSYFGQLFREVTGQSPQRYLLLLRMDKACRLMLHSKLPINAVARSVGYDDPLLFSKMFHRIMGCSPTQYRQDQANGHA